MSLKKLLEEIQRHTATGDRKSLNHALRQIMENRKDYYHDSNAQQLQEGFSDTLFKILLLELDEEEQDSIETAELAYIGIGTALKNTTDNVPELYKRRLLLLHYFSDYFTDAMIGIFLEKYRDDHLLQARNLALECLEKMQLSDMFWLEENHPDFLEKDEQLNEACNAIEASLEPDSKEREQAAFMHQILQAYLVTKYKN